MPIPLTCSCGRRVMAPEKFAGKSVRCSYCGASLPVPAPAAAAPAESAPYELAPEAPRAEPAVELAPLPAGPRRRAAGGSDRPLIERRDIPLPLPAILLAVLGVLDSVAVLLTAGVLVLASALMSNAAGAADSRQKAADAAVAPADQAVERIKKAGGTVSLNLDERSRDGGRVRRLEYLTAGGEKKTELIPLDDSAAPLSREEQQKVQEIRTVGTIAGVIGILLGLAAAAKILSAGGVFLRRDWGRSGMVTSGAAQSLLLIAAVATGGTQPSALLSLLVCAAGCVYFLSARARASCSL